jgi:predicted RNA binding protein YcfA (HicA-like mRNA interferase family)
MLKSAYGNLFRRSQRLYMVEAGTPLSRVFTESASSLYIQIHPDDLKKRLGKTFGYQTDHQTGSHQELKSPREGCPPVTIPLDNPVTRTVLLSIMRRLGYRGQHKNFYKEIGLM